MKGNTLKIIVMLLALLLVAACRPSRTIVTPSQDFTTTQDNLTQKEMRQAILAGCAKSKWAPSDTAPGIITARITVRGKHTVEVSIPYTSKTYRIEYKSSSNMEYKEKDGTKIIHPNYNNWVTNLSRNIDMEINQIRLNKK